VPCLQTPTSDAYSEPNKASTKTPTPFLNYPHPCIEQLDKILKQQINGSVRKYIIHNAYLLHVAATNVAIFSEVHYKNIYSEILQKYLNQI
jgi:hypothetical protein